MNSNRSEMLFVGKSEMAALMGSRFACAENNANWSQILLGLVETLPQSLQAVATYSADLASAVRSPI